MFTNYFDNNRNIALVHQAYCIQNPLGREGYSESCWGMTASDDPSGYDVHEPTSGRDNGTISPTAALGCFPYTPEESMLALKHFYRELGDKTWDWMGFYDAFNQNKNWWASSYLAIDQGPIIIMIENYRTQLLWNLFMSNPEIQPMLDAIGFYESPDRVERVQADPGLLVYPNPVEAGGSIHIHSSWSRFEIFTIDGKKIATVEKGKNQSGDQIIDLSPYPLTPGIYLAKITKAGISPMVFKLNVQ
jgi:hypothetical protein